jgi:hypothetical protein
MNKMVGVNLSHFRVLGVSTEPKKNHEKMEAPKTIKKNGASKMMKK